MTCLIHVMETTVEKLTIKHGLYCSYTEVSFENNR